MGGRLNKLVALNFISVCLLSLGYRSIRVVVIWGLEYCRLLVLGFGWLEALPWRPLTLPAQFSQSAFGFGNPVSFES